MLYLVRKSVGSMGTISAISPPATDAPGAKVQPTPLVKAQPMLPAGMVYLVRLVVSSVRYQPLMSMAAAVLFLNSTQGSAAVLVRTSLMTMELLLRPGSATPGAPLIVVLARQPSWVLRTASVA